MAYAAGMEQTNSPAMLGDAIRRRRSALGLTQEDLALSIGVNRKVIGQLEGGKETVQLAIALDAAQALGLDVGVETRGETGS
jgi:HTH-type transcriptional regulator/antitoxin HipB